VPLHLLDVAAERASSARDSDETFDLVSQFDRRYTPTPARIIPKKTAAAPPAVMAPLGSDCG